MAEVKKYWKGLEELKENSPIMDNLRQNEFASEMPVEDFLGNGEMLAGAQTSRRDFLKYLGFSTAAAALAACEAPIVESIPYVVKPDSVLPGVPNYYATTYYDGNDFASILVKTREGRPIKVDANREAPFNGSANARVQAAALSLYDNSRLKAPLKDGAEVIWSDILLEVKNKVANSKSTVLLSNTIVSPTMSSAVQQFASEHPNFRHVSYDAFSLSGKLDAWQTLTGRRALPLYDISKVGLIVSIGADFLSDYNGQSMTSDYSKARELSKDMARHIQFESVMSLSGSNADKRVRVKPSEQSQVLLAIYNEIAKAKGEATLSSPNLDAKLMKDATETAKELLSAKSSVVFIGGNRKDDEVICFGINKLLGNIDSTVLANRRSRLRSGDDSALSQLIADMNSGKIEVILLDSVNPVYNVLGFAEALAKVEYKVSIAERLDETSSLSQIVLPMNHGFESWTDALPADGVLTIGQPLIRPLFNTMQREEILLAVMGVSAKYYDYLKNFWTGSILTAGMGWNQAVHDGYYKAELTETESGEQSYELAEDISTQLSASAKEISSLKSGGTEIAFYQKASMGVGVLSNNPWLQEMPDPLTRASWDNYLTISASQAKELGLENYNTSNGSLNGSKVDLTVNGVSLQGVPVYIQPGQTYGSVGLAIGYGRTLAGKAGNNVGVNAFMLIKDGMHSAADVRIEKSAAEDHEFACVQLHHTMMGRDIVREISLDTFLNKPAKANGEGWNERTTFETYEGALTSSEANLWKDFDHKTGHFWNLSIDLTKCIGCGACVIACHAENNVPVVGKDEVRRSRDMHWLRIDRYFSSDMNEEVAHESNIGAIDMFNAMEEPSESPEVVFQPVMCQHCNHAPCETVCPVAATTHSAEGLNHMAYNRCIGTRYCANNCPYKVRRFNWFLYHDNQDQFDVNYAMNDDLGKMVLNPDVTVRSRGVMEKCSMCIQRIQYGKLEAKKEGRPVEDGEIQTACAQACDTGAIRFGDANDTKSEIAKLKKDDRMYHLLDEVGTQPSVFYQTKVRNKA
jgi:MoCo/4Fe-4S cofactor protein with predicted Tat translocation signal